MEGRGKGNEVRGTRSDGRACSERTESSPPTREREEGRGKRCRPRVAATSSLFPLPSSLFCPTSFLPPRPSSLAVLVSRLRHHHAGRQAVLGGPLARLHPEAARQP